jgi:hypothetical protein
MITKPGLVAIRYGAAPRIELEGPPAFKVWWKVVGEPAWVFAQTWSEARTLSLGKAIERWRA